MEKTGKSHCRNPAFLSSSKWARSLLGNGILRFSSRMGSGFLANIEIYLKVVNGTFAFEILIS